MERIKRFHETGHVKERSVERELSLADMKAVVNYHNSKMQQYRGDHGGFVYKFKKSVNGKTLAVIAEVKKYECWLISGFIQ